MHLGMKDWERMGNDIISHPKGTDNANSCLNSVTDLLLKQPENYTTAYITLCLEERNHGEKINRNYLGVFCLFCVCVCVYVCVWKNKKIEDIYQIANSNGELKSRDYGYINNNVLLCGCILQWKH